jgi:aminopeptidase N
VPALTQAEARVRAGLLDVESYQVFVDLATDPVRARTEIRFRCSEPGASTFADLATASVLSAELNGRTLGQPKDGRLSLPGLDPDNLLRVEAQAAHSHSGRGLTRFADPADGSAYAGIRCYPSSSAAIFCCFDQPDLSASMTISVAVPAGWECMANGSVVQRPAAGQAGVWRFAAVPAMRPFDVAICAGPFVAERRTEGTHGTVSMGVWRRRSLAGADGVAGLARFGDIARQAIEWYERILGVPCPVSNYDIVFVPDLIPLALSVPGLMVVRESLLARMSDPGDDFVATVCAHEVAHLWFGSLVGMRWWDDVWLDEALATYLSYTAEVGALTTVQQWTAFCYRDKERAYRADTLPGREPVSSPVASAGEALSKPGAITYCKGASVIRQLAVLIGDDALRAGLADYLTRYRAAGVAALDDLVGCWSRACGRDLAGWADEWLRTEGVSTLRPDLTAAPDGTIGSFAIRQDTPRTHVIGIGLYDLAGSKLRLRRVVRAEVSGDATAIPSLAGARLPNALVLNDGDLAYAQIGFDEQTFQALAAVAMEVGDALTEALCWNAAWQMVISGDLAAADLASLIIRRLPGLPSAGTEVLLERAVKCADVYAPAADRAAIRERLAGAALVVAEQAIPGSAGQRAVAASFAASAHSNSQLELLRSWLTGGSLPAGLALTADLRGRILFTLSARGLADDDSLDAMADLDPVAGEQNRATCRAMRPDPAAKEAAWNLALADDQDWRMAQAHARGLWIPGQEDIMTGYRDRYFSQALPALAGREPRVMRSAARLMYPATLISPATLAASRASLELTGPSPGLRVIVLEQDAILRSALTARSASRRPGLS